MTHPITDAIDAFRKVWPGPEISHAAARDMLAALERAADERRRMLSALEDCRWEIVRYSGMGAGVDSAGEPQEFMREVNRLLGERE